MKDAHMDTFQLRDRQSGSRKYLTEKERLRFRDAVAHLEPEQRLFCETIYYTGCRISEAHGLRHGHIDFDEKLVVIETLKRRKSGIYRAIPVPSAWLRRLDEILRIRKSGEDEKPLWDFSLSTGYRTIKLAMAAAKIQGDYANARGLRHSFGIKCAQSNINPRLISKWMGHAKLETTMIYLDAIDAEERNFAKRLW